MSKGPPPVDFDDNPEWTEETTARARPAGEVLPAALAAGLVKNKGGRPVGSNKEPITLRMDRDVAAYWRATGPGWQSRINTYLGEAAGGAAAGPLYQGQGVGARLSDLVA